MVQRHDDKYRAPAGSDPLKLLAERMKRIKEEESRDRSQAAIADLVKTYPNVHAVLMAAVSSEEVSRGAAINIWEQDGKLTACLTLRWLDRKCFYTSETWEGLWAGLEEAIISPTTSWRTETGKRVSGRSHGAYGKGKGRSS